MQKFLDEANKPSGKENSSQHKQITAEFVSQKGLRQRDGGGPAY